MVNQEQLNILQHGTETWNTWRQNHPEIRPNFSEVDLSNVAIRIAGLIKQTSSTEIDLNLISLLRGVDPNLISSIRANLSGANLSEATIIRADLSGTSLIKTNFSGTNLNKTNLSNTNLREANLSRANLMECNLIGADLTNANLSGANFAGANLTGANLKQAILKNCFAYGVSIWNTNLEEAIQENIFITRANEPKISIDNLKVAQFVYLLLNNQEIRHIINTITSKVVLLLGRFTPERKTVLNSLKEELRQKDYLPILFDFEKPDSRNFTETIRTLAHLAHFVLADITEPSSIPQELQAIVPTIKVPIQPLLLKTKREYAMFVDFRDYPWLLPTHLYEDQTQLIQSLEEVIAPAEKAAQRYKTQRQQEKLE